MNEPLGISRWRRVATRSRWFTLHLGVLGLWLAPLSAHPIHRSSAEANYNRETRCLEVALRVYADDFETVLSALAERPVSLQKTPAAELDPLIRAYLVAHFIVKDSTGRLADQRWRGRELKPADNEILLRFDIPLPNGVAGAKVHHAMLVDRFSDQLNSVVVRDGERKVTLVFLPNHSEKLVRFPP